MQPAHPGRGNGPDLAQRVSIDEDRYPPLLRLITDPPASLYVKGDLSALREPQLAVVGSRRASAAALRLTEVLCGQLVEAGLTICSGLALGIDGAAHRGALRAGGRSVAVMATGIDRVYPARHRALAADLQARGCLVTEFPPGTPPRPGQFPRRNRIISGLCLGVLVVEAALASGSLITARTALEQGREVFALPWSLLHAGGAGCLRLIRDGARMVQEIDDILEELEALGALQRQLSGNPELPLPTPASPLLPYLGFEAVSVDDLAGASGLGASRVLAELSKLELEGVVVRCAGGYIRS